MNEEYEGSVLKKRGERKKKAERKKNVVCFYFLSYSLSLSLSLSLLLQKHSSNSLFISFTCSRSLLCRV